VTNKILIADSSPEQIRPLLHAPQASNYQIETAVTASECLQKIHSFSPHLILLDLLLHEIHGIELLRKIKSDPALAAIGVIISSSYPLLQSYTTAIKLGALYFLNRPSTTETTFDLIERFFQGTLHPDPFITTQLMKSQSETQCYLPKIHAANRYLRFWGTRGSNPVSGAEYLRYGGSTSCLEVRAGDDLIIIDAGTGIRPLGRGSTLPASDTLHLFFSHTHWDHLTGFPFFEPIYNSDKQIAIWSPIGFEKPTSELFTEMLAYSYFPVRLDDIRSKITFHDLIEGATIKIGEIEISTHYTFHPGATLCFKIRIANKLFGYVTDNEFLTGYHGNPNSVQKEDPILSPYLSLIDFFQGCDFLIHEAQYFPIEYLKKAGWGHSSVSNASLLIKYAHIREWIVTHHDPAHTDSDLQKKLELHKDILEECKIPCLVRFAYDGLIYLL
jgi:ribonuclease BN (tRNA processing enzyme)/ActR/RegA family two-component response regulator